MMRLSIVILALILTGCYHPPYEQWRQQYGFDRYPAEGPFCGVAADPLSQQHADRLLTWCREHVADKRWFMRVGSDVAYEQAAESWGYSRVSGSLQYVDWAPDAWGVNLREDLFDRPGNAVERVLQHELCHANGEWHPRDRGFRVPDQCPVK